MHLNVMLRSPNSEVGGSNGGDSTNLTQPENQLDRISLSEAATERDTPDVAVHSPNRERPSSGDELGRLDHLQSKLKTLEQVYQSALREREIASALIGKPLVPGAAGQLLRLLSDDFDVIQDESRVRVVAADGRSVEQTITERLASPEFAHFCLPTSRGGTSARGETRSTQPVPSAPRPRTLGEAAVLQWRSQSAISSDAHGSRWGRHR